MVTVGPVIGGTIRSARSGDGHTGPGGTRANTGQTVSAGPGPAHGTERARGLSEE
ncbi:hypothetical protein GCM10010266_28390 [Streptomyces griseomycini]|nr:hypothetical protein GCM10010266_28390 [Streptomyces griseomycini]GGR19288.1 hypothetical protein GCM10015536_26200 [Streptomyces griseomycini]